jgi:hypothetical protein
VLLCCIYFHTKSQKFPCTVIYRIYIAEKKGYGRMSPESWGKRLCRGKENNNNRTLTEERHKKVQKSPGGGPTV